MANNEASTGTEWGKAAGNGRDWRPRFFTIWTGQAFSIVGSNVAQFALVWWLTETTGSATVLATATLVAMLPGIILGPFVGAAVDRWNRRLVMIGADSLVALVSAWLGYLFWAGAMQPWHLYVAMLLRSLAGSFHWPAMQASTSLMVPKEHLSRIAGANQTLHGSVNVVAPPLGALLLSLMPLHGVMAMDVVTALVAILPLFFLSIPQPARSLAAEDHRPGWLWRDMHQGLRYVWSWKGLFLLLMAATLLNFLGMPAFSLTPILVSKYFGGGAPQLGWINSAWGVGMLAGGLILSAWGGFRRRIVTSLMGVIIGGVGTLLIGLAPTDAFWLALAGMFVTGLMNPMVNGPVMATIQAIVDPEMQGRVFTLTMSLASAASPLSLAIAGPVADALGVPVWYVISGVGSILVGLAGFLIPSLLNLEEGHGRREGEVPKEKQEAPVAF